jgi:hypothetical protein
MRRAALIVVLAVLLAACGSDDEAAPAAYPLDGRLRLNHVQVLGSHNSYHLQAPEPLFSTIMRLSAALARSLEYSHSPLDVQLDTQGIRQVELDVFADPHGGLYAQPLGLRILTRDRSARLPGLEAPGFKVLHVQDLDFMTTCETFIGCLTVIKQWSDAHPGHVPMLILVEAKDDDFSAIGLVTPVAIGAPELDALDAEIRTVFPPRQIVTPDEVRGRRGTLEEAIRTDGWPTLGATRGRVLFALDNEDVKRDAYVAGHPSLRGRVMFTSSRPPAPEAAFVKLNDPLADYDLIRRLVAEGFIIRTRADADTVQARSGDTVQRDAALASGAQLVSTDYPVPDPRFGTGYQVTIPEGMPARCNPVSAPAGCTPQDIENPVHLATR